MLLETLSHHKFTNFKIKEVNLFMGKERFRPNQTPRKDRPVQSSTMSEAKRRELAALGSSGVRSLDEARARFYPVEQKAQSTPAIS